MCSCKNSWITIRKNKILKPAANWRLKPIKNICDLYKYQIQAFSRSLQNIPQNTVGKNHFLLTPLYTRSCEVKYWTENMKWYLKMSKSIGHPRNFALGSQFLTSRYQNGATTIFTWTTLWMSLRNSMEAAKFWGFSSNGPKIRRREDT